MHNSIRHGTRCKRRSAFTLIELLVTITIIGIMSGMVMMALVSAQEGAKEHKTKALITKLNNLIMPRYEAYRTRRVPIQIPPGMQPGPAAKYRLDALRELMRVELPDRWTDITDNPVAMADYAGGFQQFLPYNGNKQPLPYVTPSLAMNSLNAAYYRAYKAGIAAAPGGVIPPELGNYQGAECLYLIVTLGSVDELGGRELFNESNIGDVDGDGFKEFIDGWGRPIRFLRCAPGFSSELSRIASGTVNTPSAGSFTANPGSFSPNDNAYNGYSVLFTSGAMNGWSATISQYSAATLTFTLKSTTPAQLPAPGSPVASDAFEILDPDPFDARQVYPTLGQEQATFTMYPLIYSAGPDGIYSIVSNPDDTSAAITVFPYHIAAYNNNPFVISTSLSDFPTGPYGTQADLSGESGASGWYPNGKFWLDNIHNHMLMTK